ncbi:hypothetical protein D3C84_1098890 [compost metagenome]
MLDRLEAADRLAELFALGHVVHRQVEHALRQPQQLPGHRQRTTVQHALQQGTALLATGNAGLRRRSPGHLAQAA